MRQRNALFMCINNPASWLHRLPAGLLVFALFFLLLIKPYKLRMSCGISECIWCHISVVLWRRSYWRWHVLHAHCAVCQSNVNVTLAGLTAEDCLVCMEGMDHDGYYPEEGLTVQRLLLHTLRDLMECCLNVLSISSVSDFALKFFKGRNDWHKWGNCWHTVKVKIV